MNCLNQFLYIVRPGDTLYELANQYNTTVENLLKNNTYLSPHNLSVGTRILICPNSKINNMNHMGSTNANNDFFYTESTLSDNMNHMDTSNENNNFVYRESKLSVEMNTLWEQHVYWTRLLLISIAENLKDLDATKNRLLRNPSDIANVYKLYYGENVARTIERLLIEHLVIGGDLITALKNRNNMLANELEKKWYKNADDMAEAFASFNPYYNREELRKMLYTHLQLITDEVGRRLAKNYVADVMAFDKMEKEALEMAKYFAHGIMKQFPNMYI